MHRRSLCICHTHAKEETNVLCFLAIHAFIVLPLPSLSQLQGLRQGTLHFPSGTELIRHCLQQASAAQARDPQLAPAAPTPPVTMEAPQGPWQGPLSPTPLAAPVAKRAKMLHSWAAKVYASLTRSLKRKAVL